MFTSLQMTEGFGPEEDDMEMLLLCVKGLVPEAEFSAITESLQTQKIAFRCQPDAGGPKASVRDLLAPAILILSTDLARACLLGVAGSATYDAVKLATLTVFRKIVGRTLTILHAGGRKSQIPATLDLLVSLDDRTNLRVKFKSTLSPALQETCVNKAFDLVCTTDRAKLKGDQTAVFDEAKQEWIIFSDVEFIQRVATERSQSSHQ